MVSTCGWRVASAHHLNPFDLPQALDPTDGLDPLAEQSGRAAGAARSHAGRARQGPGTTYERAALDQALYQTYAAVGITADPSTHDRPAPLMRDLQAVLAGTAGELAAGLATRLDAYVSGVARGGPVRRTDQRVAESTAGRVPHSAAARKSFGRWRFT